MDRSTRWEGEAEQSPPVIELPNGDVWVGDAAVPGGRRFRCHLGHVVEIFESGRIRRVGTGLRHARPWLLVNGSLESVIERALQDRERPAAPWPEPADVAPAPLHTPPPGLLARLAALLHRGAVVSAAQPAVAAPPWRDTMPWTHPR